tara:strand:- start:657 stop:1112 length:456 start_codon:yes stop_codon:yes gene_type:complete
MSNKKGFWFNNSKKDNYLRKEKLAGIKRENNLFKKFIDAGKSLVEERYTKKTRKFIFALFIRDDYEGWEFVMCPKESYSKNTFTERLKTWTYVDSWVALKDDLEDIQSVVYQSANYGRGKIGVIKAKEMINQNKKFIQNSLDIEKILLIKN